MTLSSLKEAILVLSVRGSNNTNLDDHTQQTTNTPGFKPFTIIGNLRLDQE